MNGQRLALCVLVFASVSCGGKSTPTAPSPPPIAQLAGTWSGTFESNWPSFTQFGATMQLSQTSSTVTGTWASQDCSCQGNVAATVDASSMTGTVTISTPARGGGICQGTASISGSVSASQINVSAPGFGQTSCTGMPTNIRFVLQRR